MAKRTIQSDAQSYYVYQIVVDGAVRYIGKGVRYRINRHIQIANRLNRKRAAGQTVKALKFHNRLAKSLLRGATVSSAFIATGLSHETALNREIYEIAKYRRGQLWNETLGGEGFDSETAKALWKDPEYRAKRQAAQSSDEFRDKVRKTTIAQFSDPESRANNSKTMKRFWSDAEFREKMTKAVGRRWEDPEFRERHRASTKMHWDAVPERRAARAEITRSYASKPEFRESAGKRFKESWKDPEFRKKAMAHWNDPVRKKAIVDSWTPEFIKKRGEAISRGLKAKAAARKSAELDQ
jgi:hypothetical protein